MAIYRTDWSRAGGKETDAEKRGGSFREVVRTKPKTADLMVVAREDLGAARWGLRSLKRLVAEFVNHARQGLFCRVCNRVACDWLPGQRGDCNCGGERSTNSDAYHVISNESSDRY